MTIIFKTRWIGFIDCLLFRQSKTGKRGGGKKNSKIFVKKKKKKEEKLQQLQRQ